MPKQKKHKTLINLKANYFFETDFVLFDVFETIGFVKCVFVFWVCFVYLYILYILKWVLPPLVNFGAIFDFPDLQKDTLWTTFLAPCIDFEFPTVVRKRSQCRPYFSVNHNNYCALGTYCF